MRPPSKNLLLPSPAFCTTFTDVMIWGLFIFLFGLVIGSFLNVCIYRIPRDESVVFPGSHCPNCQHKIAPYDNIPLFSYLWLRGRCRACGTPIPLHYPLVELLTGVAYVLCYWNAPTWSYFFVSAVFVTLVIPLIFIDYYHYILPDVITYPGMILGIALSPLHPAEYWNDLLTVSVYELLNIHIRSTVAQALAGSLLSVLLGGGTLWLVAEVYFRLRKIEGLGLGESRTRGLHAGARHCLAAGADIR